MSEQGDIPITAEELAAALHRELFTIKRWSRTGVIPTIDLGHRTKLFHLPSVQAALLKRQVKGTGKR